MIGTKEHYDLLDAFERCHRSYRLDREARDQWPRGDVYQAGDTNAAYTDFISGYMLGKAIGRSEAQG